MLMRWLINTAALLVTAYLLPGGLHIDGFVAALVAALILGIVNAVVRPIVLILTLPFNVLTLGLFTFIVNALMLTITAVIVPGFHLGGFRWALIGSIVLSIISTALSWMIEE